MLCPHMGVRKVQLEYCCESKLFAPSDVNLTPQKYKHFSIPQVFLMKMLLFILCNRDFFAYNCPN